MQRDTTNEIDSLPSPEEGLTAEDALEYLLEKVEYQDQIIENMALQMNELWIDHESLFRCLRSTGQFSKDMWTRVRRNVVKELEDEET